MLIALPVSALPKLAVHLFPNLIWVTLIVTTPSIITDGTGMEVTAALDQTPIPPNGMNFVLNVHANSSLMVLVQLPRQVI